MPAKRMGLQISNGNNYSRMFVQPPSQVAVNPNASLNSNMLKRVHNVRPGCGSCGKK